MSRHKLPNDCMGSFSIPFYEWELDYSLTISYFNTRFIVLIIIYSKVLFKDIIQQAFFWKP